jgi:hypothetical protein
MNIVDYKQKNLSIIVVIGISLFSICIHLLPFFIYQSHPLGYDTGFYRRYLIEPNVSFPDKSVPGLGDQALVPRIILDSLRSLDMPTDIILYGTYITWFALLPIFIYFLILTIFKNKHIGYMGALLVVLSPVQYTAFYFMFWKNALALCLLILAFISIEKKKWIPILALGMLIAMTHTTTSIMYVGTLGLLMLTDYKHWKKYTVNILVTSAFIFGLQPQTYSSIITEPVGFFLIWREYWALSFPILILAVYGLCKSFRDIKKSSVLAFLAITFSFTIFRLPFYERIFIFCDIASIIFASYGIYCLISKKNYVLNALLIIFLGIYIGGLSKQVEALHPWITESNLENIKLLDSLIPKNSTVLTTTDEAPWLQGFTHAHIAAPGMLHDVHDQDEWNNIWDETATTSQSDFFKKYTHPLFIYTDGDLAELFGTEQECLKKFAKSLWINRCN